MWLIHGHCFHCSWSWPGASCVVDEEVWAVFVVKDFTILVRGGGTWHVAVLVFTFPDGPHPGCTVAPWCLASAMYLVGIDAEGRSLYVSGGSKAGCSTWFGWQASFCGYWLRPFSGCPLAPEACKKAVQ